MSGETADPAPGRRRIPPWGWHAIRIGVVTLIILLIIWRVDWNVILSAFRLDNVWLLAVAVLLNFASVLLKGLAWKGVVDGLAILKRPTRFFDLLSPLMVGFLFNTILAARVGEIAKVLLARRRLVKRHETVTTTVLLGTVVVENIITTIAWVFLVILIGLVLPLPSYAWIITTVLGVICVVVVGAALLQNPKRQVSPWLSTGSIWRRVTRAFQRLWAAVHESHASLRNPRRMSLVAVPSFGTWLAQWAGIYATLVAFGLGHVGWGGAGLLLVTITVAQSFPILPGNLVVFQAAAVVPLTASYGVSAADALAFSIVLQATEMIVGVVIGFIFLLFEGVSFKQLRRDAENEERALEDEPTPHGEAPGGA
ncbi:MAG: flippase-like domain-containing protein [Thermoleophilia bacterium]|nr:flippase-like domain-containing protein [Thermoleophilia bacterium]